MRSVKCGVWTVKCRVWSVECRSVGIYIYICMYIYI